METLGTASAKTRISKSTFTIRADSYPSVDAAGVTSQTKTSSGEKDFLFDVVNFDETDVDAIQYVSIRIYCSICS